MYVKIIPKFIEQKNKTELVKIKPKPGSRWPSLQWEGGASALPYLTVTLKQKPENVS